MPALDAVVGLGSNLGDRLALLVEAGSRVSGLGEVVARSAIYETLPIGPPQPTYLNAALRLRTHLEPLGLLDALVGVERGLGRERRERWGPRLIDLDLLWLAGLSIKSERLVVPHAELRQRAFALVPLLDVAPDARDPVDGAAYSGISAALDRHGMRELPRTREAWPESR